MQLTKEQVSNLAAIVNLSTAEMKTAANKFSSLNELFNETLAKHTELLGAIGAADMAENWRQFVVPAA